MAMLNYLSIVLPAFLLIPLVRGQNTTINLWPEPKTYTAGNTPVCIADDFKINIPGDNVPQDLWDAVGRASSRIWNTKHEYLSVNWGAEFFNDFSNPCEHYLHSLDLVFSSENRNSIRSVVKQQPVERMALEQYNLTIPLNGSATVIATNALGLYRGLTSFEGLWFYLAPPGQGGNTMRKRWSGGEALYAPWAPYEIQDAPSFPWRSVLLDTSRHFYPLQDLRKMLDTMAMVKMSTFQWHITDSQSFPLELSDYPELANKGAYSPARHYSEQDVKDLIAYAAERGIEAYLEIDSPGHTASIGESHPEYIACFDYPGWATNNLANEPPPGQLRFADPSVSNWFKGVLANAVSLVEGNFFSTGGDEINQNCMLNDSLTMEKLNAFNWTLDQALNNFTAISQEAIHAVNKTVVVWEEMVDAFGNITAIHPDTVVLVWIDSSHNREVANRGFRFVHASSDYFYLDCGQGEWIGENGGGNSWCDPFKTWAHMYSFDPFGNLTEAQESQVLGGQASLWSEQTSSANIEVVMWPRTAAVAELFWSGPGSNGSYPRQSVEAIPRMNDLQARMVDRGVNAEPIQPTWCAIRPGACNFDS
ncbi:glycoside hydrolase superfamily [Kockovaella imperatae]|uniref:Beta-hexosaminidase n=1 Tax=Kockovaella imperatae TaxID=4999 RepID=A0A1Y1UJ20_9TREE|nr:glycoside hydrolase superfamily [Kockovaella imperatae]ORX38063.1 glycoside hydrolase superfamily [Kockovaella imperatae]